MDQSTTWTTADILTTVHRYWGYGELRPLQEHAIRAGLERVGDVAGKLGLDGVP